MEMVDLIFINKVDEANLQKAKNTKLELMRALHFIHPKEENWKIPVLLGSALEQKGLDTVYKQIENFITLKKSTGRLEEVRKIQAEKRFDYWVKELILQKTKSGNWGNQQYETHKSLVTKLMANPSSEAAAFVDALFPHFNQKN